MSSENGWALTTWSMGRPIQHDWAPLEGLVLYAPVIQRTSWGNNSFYLVFIDLKSLRIAQLVS